MSLETTEVMRNKILDELLKQGIDNFASAYYTSQKMGDQYAFVFARESYFFRNWLDDFSKKPKEVALKRQELIKLDEVEDLDLEIKLEIYIYFDMTYSQIVKTVEDGNVKVIDALWEKFSLTTSDILN